MTICACNFGRPAAGTTDSSRSRDCRSISSKTCGGGRYPSDVGPYRNGSSITCSRCNEAPNASANALPYFMAASDAALKSVGTKIRLRTMILLPSTRLLGHYELVLGMPHREYRTGGLAHHLLGHTPQQHVRQRTVSVAPQHDQVDFLTLRIAHDLHERVPPDRAGPGVELLAIGLRDQFSQLVRCVLLHVLANQRNTDHVPGRLPA